MSKITARLEIWVNGQLLLNKTGATLIGLGESGKPAYERRAIMGDTGPHGYIEEPIEAGADITITDRDDIRLSDLVAINGDGTLIAQAAGGSGKVYSMDNVTCLGNLSLTGGEGETTIRFRGPYWIESTR